MAAVAYLGVLNAWSVGDTTAEVLPVHFKLTRAEVWTSLVVGKPQILTVSLNLVVKHSGMLVCGSLAVGRPPWCAGGSQHSGEGVIQCKRCDKFQQVYVHTRYRKKE